MAPMKLMIAAMLLVVGNVSASNLRRNLQPGNSALICTNDPDFDQVAPIDVSDGGVGNYPFCPGDDLQCKFTADKVADGDEGSAKCLDYLTSFIGGNGVKFTVSDAISVSKVYVKSGGNGGNTCVDSTPTPVAGVYDYAFNKGLSNLVFCYRVCSDTTPIVGCPCPSTDACYAKTGRWSSGSNGPVCNTAYDTTANGNACTVTAGLDDECATATCDSAKPRGQACVQANKNGACTGTGVVVDLANCKKGVCSAGLCVQGYDADDTVCNSVNTDCQNPSTCKRASGVSDTAVTVARTCVPNYETATTICTSKTSGPNPNDCQGLLCNGAGLCLAANDPLKLDRPCNFGPNRINPTLSTDNCAKTVCALDSTCGRVAKYSAAFPAPTDDTGLCRPKNGACDIADKCVNDNKECPDEVVAAGTICREAQSACDAAERCRGPASASVSAAQAKACPADRCASAPVCPFTAPATPVSQCA